MDTTFKIFGFTSPISQLINAEDYFSVEREIDDYGDEACYLSNKVYQHRCDDDLDFDYQYAIEAYHNSEDGKNETYYTLYIVPTVKSLSEKRQQSVIEFAGTDEPTTMDVKDYGMCIVMERTTIQGEFDPNVIDKIASIVYAMDRIFFGFSLDKYQNRIGATGWDYLRDFIHDIDFTKAVLERWKQEQE